MIDDTRYREELLMLARAIKSLQQAKALTSKCTRLESIDERERVLIECLLKTIFNQEGDRND